jgi:hypothetical protein
MAVGLTDAVPAIPLVRPLPLAEIDSHVEGMHNLLCDWFHEHADLTNRQVPFELFWGWVELTEALEGIMDVRDRIDAGALVPHGVNDA